MHRFFVEICCSLDRTGHRTINLDAALLLETLLGLIGVVMLCKSLIFRSFRCCFIMASIDSRSTLNLSWNWDVLLPSAGIHRKQTDRLDVPRRDRARQIANCTTQY
ncbi:uncharacterized protein LOC128092569 isoform X1 [Culex pipiens pallens]|uniref:uncharacterized protein LOC128092569 isoform X1 n=1 Tax=Culex pipiens pallens TaxID=42434 RepID=UPI0022AAD61F|nr:uncharacterized protein LOC128092569 isoform X1 [Culex pipiens pallens]